MALQVERVVDGIMDGQEALRRSRRFDRLHFAFSSPHRLV
jgi:hypothetical protein